MALAVFAVGCGSSGQGPTPGPSPIGSIHDLRVTTEDAKAPARNSPSATLLRWWHALQARDIRAVRDAYAKRVDTAALPLEIKHLHYFLVRSRPKIVGVTMADRTALMGTVVDAARFRRSDPSQLLVVIKTPTSFKFEREGGKWKLANDDYLKQLFHVEVTSGL